MSILRNFILDQVIKCIYWGSIKFCPQRIKNSENDNFIFYGDNLKCIWGMVIQVRMAIVFNTRNSKKMADRWIRGNIAVAVFDVNTPTISLSMINNRINLRNTIFAYKTVSKADVASCHIQYKLCTCLPCQFANYLGSIRNRMLLNLRDFSEKYKLSCLFW